MKNKRMLTQGVILLIGLYLGVLTALGSMVSAHAWCPYSIVCFGAPALAGSFRLLFPWAVGLGALLLLSSLWLGRAFCGWLCPVGFLQDLLARLTGKKKVRVGKSAHGLFTKLKYLVFFATLCLAVLGLGAIYMHFCPVLALSYPAAIAWSSALIIITLLLALVVSRFFCRYLCPLGALLGLGYLWGRQVHIKQAKVERNLETCIDCRLCSRFCPMQIDVAEAETVDTPECILCNTCVEQCPKRGTLKVNRTNRRGNDE